MKKLKLFSLLAIALVVGLVDAQAAAAVPAETTELLDTFALIKTAVLAVVIPVAALWMGWGFLSKGGGKVGIRTK